MKLRAVNPSEWITDMAKSAKEAAMIAERRPLIGKTEGVCGGNACIEGTRLPVWFLEHSRQIGVSDEQLLEQYPQIGRAELEAAWLYVESHRDEIEREIRENAE